MEHCGDEFKGFFVLFLISMCLTRWIVSILVEMCLEFKVICGYVATNILLGFLVLEFSVWTGFLVFHTTLLFGHLLL